LGTDAAISKTSPSASTGEGLPVPRATHIRWVFPTAILMPLSGRSVVGRHESCEVVLAGKEISARHAEVRVDGPVVAIRDLKSTNGVFVNGARLTDAPVGPGDVLRCGEWIGVAVADGGASFRSIAPGWYGGSKLLAAVEPAWRVARDLPIIVQGETGTGKEGLARAIHDGPAPHPDGPSRSPRPFVAVNCPALPGHLAEAELFGYRKGAFTGADKASVGLFRAAHGGTIFLDEILELPAAIQAKLLRVLEQREVLPLGETKPVAIDVRVVAATQEPLIDAVSDGRFRADLHARLGGLTVVLPPLRARREDIAPLFLEFLRHHAGDRSPQLEAKLVEALCLYDWPLNVRELLLLTRFLLDVHGGEPVLRKAHITERLLPPAVPKGHTKVETAGAVKRRWRKTDDAAEFEALKAALRSHGGSVAKAAVALGVDRGRAYRLLSAHDRSR
jgi:transcriptional regulator with PAS, ATPase and Fis domain